MIVNDPDGLPPERWRYLFDKIGVEFGYRPLATRIGMDHTRLRRLLLGGGTKDETVQIVADTFGVGPEVIRELRGESYVEPFTLPEDAGRLTHSERDVIRAIVRALLDARGKHDLEAETQSDASTEAGENQEGNLLDETEPGSDGVGGSAAARALAAEIKKRHESDHKPG